MKILAVVPNPCPPITGGTQRTFLLLKALEKLGELEVFIVDWFLPPPGVVPPASREFRVAHLGSPMGIGERAPWRALHSVAPALADRLARNLGSQRHYYQPHEPLAAHLRRVVKDSGCDLIVGRYLQTAANAGAFEAGPPVMLDIDDLDTQVAATRLAEAGSNPFLRAVFSRQLEERRRLVPPLLAHCAHRWVCSENDLDLIEGRRKSVLFNIPFREAPTELQPSDPDSKTLVVVAMLGWRPNYEGIDRFLARCFPEIRSRVSGARLRIVGSHLGDAARRRWSEIEGVDVIGAVDTVDAEYARAAFSIVPVFTGGGTKIKVLESFRHNRACVVSTHAHRGYEKSLPAGEIASVAADDAEFTERCVALLNDPPLRDGLAARGREQVARQFTFERFSAAVAESVQSVLATS